MTLFDDVNVLNDSNLTYDQLIEKYKDQTGIVRAVEHKDQFIEQLKTEQARLRADLETRIKYEEFLDKMNSFQSGEPPKGAPSPSGTSSDNNNQSPPVTLQDMERRLEQRDAQKRQEDNLKMVKSKLAETLGPNYSSKLKQRATELDMSEIDLVNVAEQNPKAFFQLIDTEKKADQTFTAPPHTKLNVDSFKPSHSFGQKTWSQYEELRRTKPNEYWQPRIQNEIMKLASEHGEDFMKT